MFCIVFENISCIINLTKQYQKKRGFMKNKLFSILFCILTLQLAGCSSNNYKESSSKQTSITEEYDMNKKIEVSKKVYKTEKNSNPISGSVFCADPTAIEYEGRLYVYGTNDHQQSELDTKNDYDQIDSLVVFSTDDMINWTYHGKIEVGKIAPWVNTSWAPSIVSRIEDDGLTHFYLYFSYNGSGVGVLTSTNPVTGWTDPLGKPLVDQRTKGLKNCPAPFDPGVCIDENGTGWLSFGGGLHANNGQIHSFVPKIVKLGKDLLSFDSDFVSIDAPYFFEASELNYIDGTYYYTYCNDWQDRGAEWDYDMQKPPRCSMAYLTTKTPLDADSWEYRGAYFYNSGENEDGQSGMRWGNNHTHFCEFNGKNYILHHTLMLEELQGGKAGFRSMMVDYLPMDVKTGEIPITAATRTGVSQIKLLDPYIQNNGATMFTSADIWYTNEANPASKSTKPGAWIYIKGADFGYGAKQFEAEVKGKGRIEIRFNDINSEAVSFIEFDCNEYKNIKSDSFATFDGRNQNIYIIFSNKDIELKSWQFVKSEENLRPEEKITETVQQIEKIVITAQAENPGPSPLSFIEITKDGDYSIKSSIFDEKSELLNLGYIDDKNATYTMYVKSISFETKNGIIELPIGVELNPKGSNNGLANGWQGAKIGSLIYGTDDCGLFAEETNIDWIGYRLALVKNGIELPFTSITYNVTINGLIFE